MANHPISEIRPAVISSGRFVQNESCLHQHAKEVVAGWIRATTGGPDHYLDIAPIVSRPNRPGPHSGVWVEYPILKDGFGAEQLWDEIGFDSSKMAFGPTPTFDDLAPEDRVKVACVCDIGIAHKGRIGTVVEIVHKHPTPAWKVKFLYDLDIRLIELCATRVMRAVRQPTDLTSMIYRGRR